MERFEAEQFVAFLDKIEKLKSVPRHCVTSDGTQEYVAGHCWRMAMMAYLMKDELGEIDIDKVIRMCLWHDIGEAVTGDVPTFLKNEAHEEAEKNEVDKLLSELPKPLYEEVSTLFAEIEALETKEAKVYKALDKLEAVIQHNESDISTWLPLEYELQQTYAAQNVVGFPFLESLQEQAVKRTKEKIAEQEEKAAKGNAQEAAAAITVQAVGETAAAADAQAVVESEAVAGAQMVEEAKSAADAQTVEEAESAMDTQAAGVAQAAGEAESAEDAQAVGKTATAVDTQAGEPSGESKEPDKSLGEAAGGIEVKSGMTKRQLRREEKETQKRLAREEKERQKRLAQEEKEAQKRREQEEKQRSRQEKRDARAIAREERRKECKALWHVAELAILITFVVLAIDQSGVYGFLGVWLFIALMVASVVALLYGILCAVRKKRCGIIFFVAIMGIILCTAWFVFLIFGQGLGGPVPN